MKTKLAASITTAFAFFIAAQSRSADEPKEPAANPEKKPAIEWEEVDAAEFAAKLEKASGAGEKWAANPESIILEYAGPLITAEGEKIAQSRVIRITSKGEGVPKVLNVAVIDDGLFDDAVKTERKRLALSRGEEGKWKFRKAFRSSSSWPDR